MQKGRLEAQQDQPRNPLRKPDDMRLRYGHEPSLISIKTHLSEGLQVQVRRYAQKPLVTETRRTSAVGSQKCYEMMLLDNADVVGVLQFTRYKVPKRGTDYAFYQGMRASSEANRVIAEVLLSYWPVKDLHRPFLVLDTLWVAPSHRGKLNWRSQAGWFIRSIRPDLLLLKAVPEPKGDPEMAKPVCRRRQLALQRLLRQRLRVRPIPHNDAWMYKTATDFSPPRKRPWRA